VGATTGWSAAAAVRLAGSVLRRERRVTNRLDEVVAAQDLGSIEPDVMAIRTAPGSTRPRASKPQPPPASLCRSSGEMDCSLVAHGLTDPKMLVGVM
jgi:hypothetical protein